MTNAKPKHPKDVTIKINKVIPIKADPEMLEKVKALTCDQMLEDKPLPREHILKPWLPVQGIAFIYAATGVGKTLFTLNVAYAIAGGGNFLRYAAPLPRKVLYVDGEMAYVDIHTRFMQIVSQQGALDFKENWNLLTPEKVHPFKLPKICSPEGQSFYNELIKKREIEVLFLDNLSTLSAIDENKSEQWKVIQDWLVELRSRGISVVIVHHAGKAKEGYRGTSRMLDIVDTAISLQDISKNQLESEKPNCKTFKIQYQKNRSFGGQDADDFEASLSKDGWQFQSIEKSVTEQVIDLLKLKLTHQEIALEVGKSRSYVSRIIRKAKKHGLIREE